MSRGTLAVGRVTASGYLVAVLGTEVVVQFVGMLGDPASGSLAPVQAVLYLIGLFSGVVLWWRYEAPGRASGLLALVLGLMAAMWLVEVGRQIVTGGALNPVYLAVPLLLAMIWLKPPDARGARQTVDSMAVLLAGIVVISVALESVGAVASWYARAERFSELAAGDRTTYWLPLADVLGLEGRWGGPFWHPNHAGPIGGFLIVVGLCRRGALRAALLVTGVFVLLLTASRTSMLATAAAVAVMAAAWWLTRPSAWPRWLRVAVVAAPAVVVAAAVVAVNPNLTGRTEIWPVYWRLWQESPLTGVPDRRISQAAASGELPGWASTAHNLVLDSLVRFGVVGTCIAIAVLALTAVLGVRAARRRSFVSLGITTVIVAGGLTEALVFWRLLAPTTSLLVLAIVASLEDGGAVKPPAPEPSVGSTTVPHVDDESRGRG